MEYDEMRPALLFRLLASKAPGKPAKAFVPAPKKPKVFAKAEFINTTPKGEKKDLSTPMAPAYDPKAVESAWMDWWEREQFYTPKAEEAQGLGAERKFVMMIPPPNVTGSLHLGHALTSAIEDTLARWNRMHGKSTLWLPGLDHAGIATQSVVEKALMREQNMTRHDLGREAFIAKVWEWKNQYGSRILEQSKRLGVSTDSSRLAFTLDEKLSKAVTEAFVRMWEMGIVYRANRLVNWSCSLKSAISDLEVEFEEFKGSTRRHIPGYPKSKKFEFGVLHKFAYKVADSDEEVIVATTRLETMLGDTAVAVHPTDPRYQHLIGKRLIHPFVPSRSISIIADPVLVDPKFGTGAVKVTPAHDFNDYECGLRNHLEMVNILTDDGRINGNGGQYEGKLRFEVREEMEEHLKAMGLYRGKEDNDMRVGFCARSGDAIEPYLKPQWYVNCKDLAQRAMAAVTSKQLRIIPEFHESTWFQWLGDIKDWCVSRQLWWGHRIPAYKVTISKPGTEEIWVCGRNESEALANAEKYRSSAEDVITVAQDEDVLDTWFSSGLFPFSTLGWPEDTADLRAFYPGTLLETGHDILFFWVARMVMMGLCLTDKLPFHTVYLHAMVRDAEGRKMSKSLGNVIDPLEVIDGSPLDLLIEKLKTSNLKPEEVSKSIEEKKRSFPEGMPECGADGLRLGLLAYTIQGRNINLDIDRVVGYRQFGNKLWNAMKFVLNCLGPDYHYVSLAEAGDLSFQDRWILHKLTKAVKDANRLLGEYQFGETVQVLHGFWLYQFCDVYLEAVKPVIRAGEERSVRAARSTLYTCVDYGLRLLHPMIPFITEELWQRLPGGEGRERTISRAQYPTDLPGMENESVEEDMKHITTLVDSVRSAMASLNLFEKKPCIHVLSSAAYAPVLAANCSLIQTLAKSGLVMPLSGGAAPEGCQSVIVDEKTQLFIEVKGLVNVAEEIAKQQGLIEKKEKYIEGLTKKLETQKTMPEKVRAELSGKAEAAKAELVLMQQTLRELEASA